MKGQGENWVVFKDCKLIKWYIAVFEFKKEINKPPPIQNLKEHKLDTHRLYQTWYTIQYLYIELGITSNEQSLNTFGQYFILLL